MLETNLKQALCRGNYPIKLGHMVEKNSTVDNMTNVKRIILQKDPLL